MRVKGKVAFVYLANPDTEYTPAWKVTVVVDKSERDRLVAACGIKFTRTDGDFWEELGDYKSVFVRNCEKRGKAAGKPNQPPQVAINGKRIDISETPMVASGSVAEVEFSTYDWSYVDEKTGKKRSGVGTDFKGINFLELIEYVPEDTEEEESPDVPEEDIPW